MWSGLEVGRDAIPALPCSVQTHTATCFLRNTVPACSRSIWIAIRRHTCLIFWKLMQWERNVQLRMHRKPRGPLAELTALPRGNLLPQGRDTKGGKWNDERGGREEEAGKMGRWKGEGKDKVPYWYIPRPIQPSISPGSVNEYQLWLGGKGRYGSFR